MHHMTGRRFQATTPPTMKISPRAIRITPRFQPAAFCPVSARGVPVVVSLAPPTPPLGVLLGELIGVGDAEGVGDGAPPDGDADGLGDAEGDGLGDCEGEELGDCEGEELGDSEGEELGDCEGEELGDCEGG